MRKLKYTFKTDTLFKMLFVRHPDLLRMLVAALLHIPIESIEEFAIQNPEIIPENLGDKFCRLDINMTVNGQLVDLEIQVGNEGYFEDRTLLYWARDFSAALPAGQSYDQLPRTLVISIVSFKLFDCAEFHSFFQVLETARHTLLTDKLGLHFYELPKLPADISNRDMLLLWLSLFKAETVEELEKIRELEVPTMNQAINAYYSISTSSEFREVERLRAKARHDEAQALQNAMQKGIQQGIQQGMQQGIQIGKRENALEIAQNLVQLGVPTDQIAKATGLSHDEINALRIH